MKHRRDSLTDNIIGGRSSILLNEDNYDYALELAPDDEYRQVAEAMSDIVDFHEIDMDVLISLSESDQDNSNSLFNSSTLFDENDLDIEQGIPFNQPQTQQIQRLSSNEQINQFKPFQPHSRISTEPQSKHRQSSLLRSSYNADYNRNMEDNDEETELFDVQDDSNDQSDNNIQSVQENENKTATDRPTLFKLISRSEFSFRVNKLSDHKKWVEKAARRSSIGFHRDIILTNEKETMDRFLVILTKGTHIRRHQSGLMAETVRLFSITGCREIQWEKPQPKELMRERRIQGIENHRINALHMPKHDRSIFDYCVAICGCGDDLVAGNDSHQNVVENMNSEENEGKGGIGLGKWFYNFGYKRSGTFRELDILAVHPACKEDPTAPGLYGTESLRGSKDTYNQELTFSVIFRDFTSVSTFTSLDIECETIDTYYLLLQGFIKLQIEADKTRKLERSNSSRFNQQIGGAVTTITDVSSKVLTSLASKKKNDPIAAMYEPSHNLDWLRAFRVRGGLRTKHTSPQKMSNNGNGGNMIDNALPQLPPARFLGWNSAGTQIWARLRMAGLEVKCVFSWDLRRVLLKIRCPSWRLEEMAENMHIKLKSRDGYLKQFKVSRRDTFIPLGSSGTIFRSSERQQIIDYIIRSKIKDGGAELDENTALGKNIVQRFPLHMQSRLDDIKHSWVTFYKRERPGEIAQSWSPFAEDYQSTYTHIKQSITHTFNNLLTQPLDNIAEYFGESIAFYFAYMSFYTRWLVFPSILGVIVFCFQCAHRKLDIWLCQLFSVVVTIWACFMLAFWRQKAAALAYRWGVLDYEIEETERPQFQGSYTYDETSGEVRKTYSVWRRLCKYLVSIPVLATAILMVLYIMATIFTTQTIRSEQYAQKQDMNYEPILPTTASHIQYTNNDGMRLLGGGVEMQSESSAYLVQLPYVQPQEQYSRVESDIATIVAAHNIVLSNSINAYNTIVDFAYNTTLTPQLQQAQQLFNTYNTHPNRIHRVLTTTNITTSNTTDTNPWSRKITFSDITNTEFWKVTFFWPCLYGVLVSMMTIAFQCVALWLNDFENHRTQTTYMNRLILKVFSFQFVTVFTSLYYYAFFMRDREGAFTRISVTIFSLMTVGQWYSVFLDLALPVLYHRTLVSRMKANLASTNRKIYTAREYTERLQNNLMIHEIAKNKLDKRSRYLQQGKSKCWEEALYEKYNNFSDYTNMVIQIGFVLCFSGVFPLAPFFALLNNIVLIRANAYKICCTRQRPIAQKIGGIGVWEDVLQVMSVGGILTNCAIMGVTSRQLTTHLHFIGNTGLALVLFSYEQLILLFKYWLHSSIPRVPPSVQRAQYRERKSIDRKSLTRNKKEKKKILRQASECHVNYSYNHDHDDNADEDEGGDATRSRGDSILYTAVGGEEAHNLNSTAESNQVLSTNIPFGGRRGSLLAANSNTSDKDSHVQMDVSTNNDHRQSTTHSRRVSFANKQSAMVESKSDSDDGQHSSRKTSVPQRLSHVQLQSHQTHAHSDSEQSESDSESQSNENGGSNEDEDEEWQAPSDGDEQSDDDEDDDDDFPLQQQIFVQQQQQQRSPSRQQPLMQYTEPQYVTHQYAPHHQSPVVNTSQPGPNMRSVSPQRISPPPQSFQLSPMQMLTPPQRGVSPQRLQHMQSQHTTEEVEPSRDLWSMAFTPDSEQQHVSPYAHHSPYIAEKRSAYMGTNLPYNQEPTPVRDLTSEEHYQYYLQQQQLLHVQQMEQQRLLAEQWHAQSPAREPEQSAPSAAVLTVSPKSGKVSKKKSKDCDKSGESKATVPTSVPQATTNNAVAKQTTAGKVSQWFWPSSKQNNAHNVLNIAPLQSRTATSSVTSTSASSKPVAVESIKGNNKTRTQSPVREHVTTDIEMGPFSPPKHTVTSQKKKAITATTTAVSAVQSDTQSRVQSAPTQSTPSATASTSSRQQVQSMNSTADKLRRKLKAESKSLTPVANSATTSPVRKARSSKQTPLSAAEAQKLPFPAYLQTPTRNEAAVYSSPQAEKWKQGITTNSTRHLFPTPAHSPFLYVEQPHVGNDVSSVLLQQQQQQFSKQQQKQQQLMSSPYAALQSQQSALYQQQQQPAMPQHEWENQRNRGNVNYAGSVQEQQYLQLLQQQHKDNRNVSPAPHIHVVSTPQYKENTSTKSPVKHKKDKKPESTKSGDLPRDWSRSQPNPFGSLLVGGIKPERVEFE